MTNITWHHDKQRHCFEGEVHKYNLHVTIEANVEFVVYIASIKPQDGEEKGTRIYAPQAFKTLEEAQEWCEKEAQYRATGKTDNSLGDLIQ